MVFYLRCKWRLKFLVLTVSTIGIIYIIYQIKYVQELNNKTTRLMSPVRGVHYKFIRYYNEDTTFICLDSKTVLDFKKVNDDYCDCDDGSDEPGTDACPGGKFYCEVDIYKRNAIPIPSSRVNDGICDCCDGSDEWKKKQMSSRVPNHIQENIGTFLSPCVYRC